MIVPLGKNGNLGVEGAQIFVKQVVFVVSAIVVEARRDAALFLGDDISPNFAVRKFQLRLDRAVGVDAVAGMDEKVGTVF